MNDAARAPGERRPRWLAAGLLAIGCVLAAWLLRPAAPLDVPDPASLQASVERGEYLATLANCRTCHTAPGGAAFAGGLRLQTPFGVIHSTNITSDAAIGIGSWSFADFYRAMKQGVRPDGTNLYPAFPYTSFARMRDEDIASVYLYLRTVAPATAPARENALGFPFNQRWGLRAWNRLFHSQQAWSDDASRPAEWNRGAYLVQAVAHCGACHTPRNLLGAERKAHAMRGGTIHHEVSPGKYRAWSAVNLTQAASGLGAWSIEDIVAYLQRGHSQRAVVHGPMVEVVVNSTAHLTEPDARAIAGYLRDVPAAEVTGNTESDPRRLAAGEILYTVHCGSCHLPEGSGDEILGVSLARSAIVQAADPSSLINVILYGPRLPPPPFVSNRSRMKPFGKRLSDADIASLASYVRASFGNSASRVGEAQVNRQR